MPPTTQSRNAWTISTSSHPASTCATVSAGNLPRPFPLFNGGITNNLIQADHYRSDQLQLSAQKRMMGGDRTGVFTWVLSYTWAKAFEENHRAE